MSPSREVQATSFKVAAHSVLQQAGEPLHYREITRRALERGLVKTQGLTPEASLGAQIAVDIDRKGEDSDFVRTGPGIYGLRVWVAEGRVKETRAGGRSLAPHYPPYDRLRALLPVLDGVPRQRVTGLDAAVMDQVGTPQENVDWSDPDAWIDERLDGEARDLARRIWEGSGRVVNPRHLRGEWAVATHHELLSTDESAALRLSDRGRQFLDEPAGPVVQEIDEAEGLVKLLSLVVELGPVAAGDLLGPWQAYLAETSNVRAESVARSYLWARLRNLAQRGYVERSGRAYAVTDAGVAYLNAAGDEPAGPRAEPDEDQKLRELLTEHTRRFREKLRDELSRMDPYAFERLVGTLLEEMGYEDVTVTAPSGDGGVDVTARIQLGITDVTEVIQVKRHAKNIQRHTLDALRGSLHRFRAVRGTIITTGDFAKGTLAAAFEPGAAPITLINGEKLVDLLIEHKVAVRRRTVELLELDRTAFEAPDEESVEAGV